MTKSVRRIIWIISGTVAGILLIISIWIGTILLCRPDYLIPDTSEWETGDIFFSVGDSWESVAVRALTGARYFEISDSTPSHCGLVIREPGGVRLVHQSTVARQIVSETPEEYLKNNGSYCLYVRRVPFTPDTLKIRHTLDSLLKIEVPFDFKFNHSEDSLLYCSEMVIRVFELNGKNNFSSLRQKGYIYPEDLLKKCDHLP